MSVQRFRNRREAGRYLAAKLSHYLGRSDLVVLALPRGGVPVGAEVARALNAPFDVFLVRKLGVPGFEELAMGAIASGGVRVLNHEVVQMLGITDEMINRVAAKEMQEMDRRERIYRGHLPHPVIKGRTVILVDDGLATGASMRAAIEALRDHEPAAIVVAVPVTSVETFEKLRNEVDDLVAAIASDELTAVGIAYDDFSQTSDEEVTTLLAQSAHEHSAHRTIATPPGPVDTTTA